MPLLKNNGKSCERRKSGRERAERSYPKRTTGSFRCMVSLDRNTHPHFFIRRAGCHAGEGFPGRCQLLLHTVVQPNFLHFLSYTFLSIMHPKIKKQQHWTQTNLVRTSLKEMANYDSALMQVVQAHQVFTR